jgi:antitoxin component YwqK of YwqJK toxin-antitoxin module
MMRVLALLALVPLVFGCAFDHTNSDTVDRPDRAIGTGATVIYPGQPAPGLGTGPGGSGSASPDAAADPGSTTLIGGMGGEAQASDRSRNVPLGPLTALFGYPFWIFGKSIQEKADKAAQEQPQSESRSGAPERSAAATPDDLEQRRVARENDEMLRQIRERGHAAESRAPTSIGEELAALERSLQRTAPEPQATPAAARAQDAVDRNGDGRPDLWIFVEEDSRKREVLDEDHDGRADRQHTYAADGRLERSEEDLDGDGRLESVVVYEAGAPLRRRADTNGDGQVDTWSFYSAGELARHEVDRDGDGFRDLMLLYEGGELAREEEDRNGDGRPDLVVRYEQGQVMQRDEDLDFDGAVDVLSFYENGKLVRREVRSEELLEKHSGS